MRDFATTKIKTTHHSCFTKAGLWYLYESELLNSSFSQGKNLSAANLQLRKAVTQLAYLSCWHVI